MTEQTHYLPEFITVRLAPPDIEAQNIAVSFSDYIKNAAARAVYPTWHENAVKANIYAITSLALSRITENFYRSTGCDFDITASTEHDVKYERGGATFENINKICDENLGVYLSRAGSARPLAAEKLPPWGALNLAESGYTAYEILQYYYGGDIELKKARLDKAKNLQ